MAKQLLIITFMLLTIGGCSSTMEKIERMDIRDAAMGCGLSYAKQKHLMKMKLGFVSKEDLMLT
jgi:hypothetical protein